MKAKTINYCNNILTAKQENTMRKRLPYFSDISKHEIEEFLRQTLHKRFGDDTAILICRWVYKTKTEINFWVEVKERHKTDKKPVLGVAYVEDFNFRIVIKNSKRDYTEQWARYLCDTLSAKAQEGRIEFDEKEYKAEYNKHWNRTKRTKTTTTTKPKQESNNELNK